MYLSQTLEVAQQSEPDCARKWPGGHLPRIRWTRRLLSYAIGLLRAATSIWYSAVKEASAMHGRRQGKKVGSKLGALAMHFSTTTKF